MIAAKREISRGDVEAAFASAAGVLANTYKTGIQEHWYAEPCGAIAWPEGESQITVRAATQWPFHVRRSVSACLGVPAASVQVLPTITGPHMDGKLWYPSLVSCHAALGAKIANKPVRLVLTREEDFAFSPKRSASVISIKTALNDKGEILAIDINAVASMGPYGVSAEETLDQIYLGSLGAYKIKNIKFSGTAVKTNIPPQGPFEGFGLAQGFFALERHVSCISDSLGVDAAQWRKKNILGPEMWPSGLLLKDPPLWEQLIDMAVLNSDYNRKWAVYELLRQAQKRSPASSPEQGPDAPLENWPDRNESHRGIGIALGFQGNGLLYPNSMLFAGPAKNSFGVEATLEKDGALIIKTTIGDQRIYVNGVARTMDVAPVIIQGRTLVPVRFISEAFGCDVNWDEISRIVYIYSLPGNSNSFPGNEGSTTDSDSHSDNKDSVDNSANTHWSNESDWSDYIDPDSESGEARVR
jgi:CO/xanthine dehydrogenase Mo-binding subunit